jgi:DNA-binding transcriptional LysR family regulator
MIEPRILSRLVYFVAVVETRGFTKAAERLGITKAVVSQQIARLEAELGSSLLIRTTRRVEPTETGRLLYERAVGILRDAQDAVGQIAEGNGRPHGTLRVVAPTDYGTAIIVPVVAEFLRLYPACQADLRLNDRIIDIMSGDIDVSIRIGWLADSSLHARRLGDFKQLLVTSPHFTEQLETVATPADLETIPFVANTVLSEPLNWQFKDEFGKVSIFRPSPTLAVDTTRAIHAAVLAGAGLSVLPDFIAADDIAAGRLLHVLPAWRLPAGGIHALFPSARFRAPRVAVFINLLAARVRDNQNTDPSPTRIE